VENPDQQQLIDLRLLRLDQARMLLSQSGQTILLSELDGVEMVQSIVDGLCDLSQRDALTGLANRRYFNSVLEREVDRVARSGDPTLLLMLDIDHFKTINDTYGHAAGDQVLKVVAGVLTQCVRPMDTVARYGGEEFAVVLPSCHRSFGQLVAERIRSAIEELPIHVSPGVDIRLTISIGGAFAPEWIRSSAALWVERADLQLYTAKTQGRNRTNLEFLTESTVSAEEKNLLFGALGADFSESLTMPEDVSAPQG
jgi:diguanylate cyclase (GGDEF)-like protein